MLLQRVESRRFLWVAIPALVVLVSRAEEVQLRLNGDAGVGRLPFSVLRKESCRVG